MKTVVLDTNVIVAGLRSRNGASFQILQRLGTGCFVPVISVPLILEYEEVLTRQQRILGLTLKDIQAVIDYLCKASLHQDIYYLWRPALKDPKDEMVLEVAANAQASAIVTFNVRDFEPAHKWNIEIITPPDFLKLLAKGEKK